jgi:hypothetical protein
MDVLVISNTPSKKSYFLNLKITFKMNFLWTDQFDLHKKAFLQITFSTRKLQMAVTLRPCCRIFHYFFHYIRRNELWYVRKYPLNTRPVLDQVGNAWLEHFCMPISLYTFFKDVSYINRCARKWAFRWCKTRK